MFPACIRPCIPAHLCMYPACIPQVSLHFGYIRDTCFSVSHTMSQILRGRYQLGDTMFSVSSSSYDTLTFRTGITLRIPYPQGYIVTYRPGRSCGRQTGPRLTGHRPVFPMNVYRTSSVSSQVGGGLLEEACVLVRRLLSLRILCVAFRVLQEPVTSMRQTCRRFPVVSSRFLGQAARGCKGLQEAES